MPNELLGTWLVFLVVIGASTTRTCPKMCICQNRQAHCDAMLLTQMPAPLQHDLEALLLRNNLLEHVNHRHLGKLRLLKHLILKGNRIRSIKPDSFKNLRALISLSLTENNIRKLSPETFKTLGELRFLSLRNNRLKHIDGLFTRLYNLQLLNLANNNIRKISHKTFKQNWRLVVLDLTGNEINFIHKHAFRTMPLIKYLVLRDNPLGVIEVNFKPNIHLELLDFTNCQLTEMVHGLPFSINDLRLSENNITKITAKDFHNTRRIRLLVLTANQISEIDDDAFGRMFDLYDLYLGGNEIEKLPRKLPRNMHGIYANSNKLKQIDLESLTRIHSLEFLYLRNNNIRVIEKEALWSLGNLRSLDISDNNIIDLKPLTFRGNKHLQRLDISRNPLLVVDTNAFLGLDNLHIFEMSSVGSIYDKTQMNPMVFKDLKKLQFLDLSNSSHVARGIARHPDSLEHMSTVQDLNLMEDELLNLPANFASHFPHLRLIKLIGNPWHCDMDILWLAYWMRNQTVEFFAPYHMICASPPELRGRLIMELHENDLRAVTRLKPYIKYIEISLQEYTERSNGTTGLTDVTKIPVQFNSSERRITAEDLIAIGNNTQTTKKISHKFYTNPGNYVSRSTSRKFITPSETGMFSNTFKTIAPSFFEDYGVTPKQGTRPKNPKGLQGPRNRIVHKNSSNLTKWRARQRDKVDGGSGYFASETYENAKDWQMFP